jgi:hypothetical protein
MGGISRQTLNDLFNGFWIMPDQLYTSTTNWTVACALGVDYLIVAR